MGRADWLAELAGRADELVSDLYGYHAVSDDWSVDLPSGLPEHLVYFVAAGSCIGRVADRPVRLGPGDAMWLPPGHRFSLSSESNPPTLYRFRMAATGQHAEPSELVLLSQAWELRAPLDSLVAELGGQLPWRGPRLRALVVLVFSTLLRLSDRSPGHPPLTATQRLVLEAWVDGDVTARPTTDDLADLLELSPDYFARRFRQTYGLPPRTWLVRRRLSLAALRLDESSDSITEVAHGFGYPDVYLFSRQFKEVFGVSPRAWRNRSRTGRSLG